ncbi:MAG: hypothetical protein EOO73_27790 [Myxococcales bacterium]|nr:MAG: hypothetical protein EOO73_27790 [Myxococcales bacterium]
MRRVYAVVCLLLLGCDPTAGLADSADAALPGTKRYFDGRGSKLAEGPWNRVVVDLDAETLYHLGARRADDDAPTFHLFGADAREGCEVTPNAGTWLLGKAPGAPFRLLPFLESMDERGRGRLRFTQLDCTVQDLVVEDAGRPYARLYDQGYLVPTGNGYTFADPWRGKTRNIATNLEAVLLWSDAVLLWADDELKSFSGELEERSRWGNAPSSVVPLGNDFLVEDADGLHRVRLDHRTLKLSAEPVLEGACRLQRSALSAGDTSSQWVIAELPCGSARPSLLQLKRETTELQSRTELPFDADARYTRSFATRLGEGDEPPRVGVAYLTDVDEDELGTLWVWSGEDAEPIRLGELAEPDYVFLQSPGGEWAGIAQVNYQLLGGAEARDWLHFRWDGAVETLGERVVRNSVTGEPLVNFDGVAGDLSRFDEGGYEVLARGVPPSVGEVTSYVGEKLYARVDQFDGTSGRLLMGPEPRQPASWATLGSQVPPEQARFAWFMPALLFLEDWDSERGTGRLVAYNYELDARSTISEGVSSFDLTSYPWDGVVYAVPAGKQRGLWFSKAK